MLTLNVLRPQDPLGSWAMAQSSQMDVKICDCKETGKAKYKGAGIYLCEHNSLKAKFP